MVLNMKLMFATAEFQREHPPENLEFFNDYFMGCVWTVLLAALSGSLLLMAWNQHHAEHDLRIPRIPDR